VIQSVSKINFNTLFELRDVLEEVKNDEFETKERCK